MELREVGDTSWLETVPRLGWVEDASPIADLPGLAKQLGLASLFIKRDDLLPRLGGGTKVRKLDYLLAASCFQAAPTWQSVGAIGSGHLVAMAQAAQQSSKRLIAHCFDEPSGPSMLANLALVAAGPTSVRFYRSRATLALLRPGLVLGWKSCAAPVVPPGGTTPRGMLGLVRAGLELGHQIRVGALPQPERIYVAWGTGGTAVGLSVGLGLAGVRSEIRAVVVVERVLATGLRVALLQRRLRVELARLGMITASARDGAPIRLDTSQIGPGYGHATAESRAACDLLAPSGLHLEPIYTGKAMAALLRDAPTLGRSAVLFWHTARGSQLSEPPAGWQRRLPAALQRRLAADGDPSCRPGRRRFLAGVGGGLLLGGGLLAAPRFGCYAPVPGWRGTVLSEREARIVAAAAEALLPVPAAGSAPTGPSALDIAARVDRYLTALPEPLRDEVHLMLTVVEQATVLGLQLRRLTSLAPGARDAYLAVLAEQGGQLGLAYRGLRDLCMVGYYQDARTWHALGYSGPWVGPASARSVDPASEAYQRLLAPPGARPGVEGRGSVP